VCSSDLEFNISLEKAGRVADFLEFAEIMCHDALERKESCGCHLRDEYQTEEGEALRRDDEFSHSTVWEYKGVGERPAMHLEKLEFENVQLATRSYK
jgi:succinate dehydrogenase / fumarate reductase flavoprotein subunit